MALSEFWNKSREIAVCAHAQYISCQKQARMTGLTSGGLKLQRIRNCHIFEFFFLCQRSLALSSREKVALMYIGFGHW